MKKKITHLSWRSVLIAIPGSILITASSTYVALRASALPWPTIFVAVLSFALMRLFGRSDVNEINVAATGMSAGAMVAGGLVFTLPGLFISGIWEVGDKGQTTALDFIKSRFPAVLLIALAGVLLGTALCWFFRKRNIEQMELPYPIGKAAASTLEAGKTGGSQALTLLVTLLLAAVLTLLRDQFNFFPSLVSFSILAVPISFSMSPMAVGIGGLIGFSSTLYWLLGAAITTAVRFIFLETSILNSIPNIADKLSEWNLTVAIALMVGAGAGTLLSFLFGTFKKGRKKKEPGEKIQARRFKAPRGIGLLSLILVAIAFVITILTGMKVFPALLLMAGAFFAAMMSSIITGQTGINPMEIFGIIVLLAVRAILNVSSEHAFFIAAIVAVTCGYAGDMMNDYKSGAILNTNPTAQFFIELIGGFAGALTASLAFLAIIYQDGGVGAQTGLPAAQAHSVTAMVAGLGDPYIFAVAALLGCALTLFFSIPAMIIGIGMMLTGFGLALPIFLGGVIEYLARKHLKDNSRQAISMGAAGLLGGEGIMGTVLAIISLFR